MQPVVLNTTPKSGPLTIAALTKMVLGRIYLGSEEAWLCPLKLMPPDEQQPCGTRKSNITITTGLDSPRKLAILHKSCGSLRPSLASAYIAIKRPDRHTSAPSTVRLETQEGGSHRMYAVHRCPGSSRCHKTHVLFNKNSYSKSQSRYRKFGS